MGRKSAGASKTIPLGRIQHPAFSIQHELMKGCKHQIMKWITPPSFNLATPLYAGPRSVAQGLPRWRMGERAEAEGRHRSCDQKGTERAGHDARREVTHKTPLW